MRIERLDHERLAALPMGVHELTLPFGSLASGTTLAFALTLARGARPGPCLWVNGQVHGDEMAGVLAALDFVRAIDCAQLAGSVVVCATANPLAMDARAKRTPHDELDLDQSYPGRAGGLTTERMAAALFPSVAACADVLISLHATSPLFDLEAFGVFKTPPRNGPVPEETLLRLQAMFGLRHLCAMAIQEREGELPGHIAGGIDYQALLLGRPAVMVELGAGQRADPRFIAMGVSGLFNVARLYRLLPGEPPPPAPALRVDRYDHVTCAQGGLFRRLVEPGGEVAPGQPLGEICDLHGRVIERPALPHAAQVIGMRRDPVVHTGDRVAFVASAWTEVLA